MQKSVDGGLPEKPLLAHEVERQLKARLELFKRRLAVHDGFSVYASTVAVGDMEERILRAGAEKTDSYMVSHNVWTRRVEDAIDRVEVVESRDGGFVSYGRIDLSRETQSGLPKALFRLFPGAVTVGTPRQMVSGFADKLRLMEVETLLRDGGFGFEFNSDSGIVRDHYRLLDLTITTEGPLNQEALLEAAGTRRASAAQTLPSYLMEASSKNPRSYEDFKWLFGQLGIDDNVTYEFADPRPRGLHVANVASDLQSYMRPRLNAPDLNQEAIRELRALMRESV